MVNFPLLRDARADLRYALRLFSRQPGILLLAIAGLSLGLGIATAAFTIMNAAVLRGDGIVESDRLPGVVGTSAQAAWTTWKYEEFERLREGATQMKVEGSLTDTTVVRTTTSAGEVPPDAVAFVSGGFFAATGGRMSAGRAIEPADERHAGAPPVVVSHIFWTSRLERAEDVVGRTIQVGRTDATIIGVAEPGFAAPNNRQLWIPLTAYGAVYGSPGRRAPENGVEIFGRLLPGASIAQAEAQLRGVAASLPADARGAIGIRLDTSAALGRGSSADALSIALFVFAVIVLVLLLACANVATVLVSTAITREKEMGVRAALGASSSRLVRQLVTESLALGAIAAMIGLMLAYWTIPVIAAMIEAPAGVDLSPDLNVFLFLGIVTLISSVGAGLAPARHSRDADLVTPLKGEGARGDRIAPRRLRSMLVGTQAAMSVLLLILSTLFVRATVQGASIDVGFEPSRLYAVEPAFGTDEARIRSFYARAATALQGIPGIVAVSVADRSPFSGLTKTSQTREQPSRVVDLTGADAGVFDALGLRIVAGRGFTRDEVDARAAVAVVSQSLARAFFNGRSPLGERLPDPVPTPSARPVIIGVVEDAIVARLHERGTLAVYEPLDPGFMQFTEMMIRVAPGASGAINQAGQRLRAIDPQADFRMTNVGSRLEQEASRPRMLATITGAVGVIAIVLCVIGLYGLTASVVGQRAREMGVRIALGASTRHLLAMLMWDSLRPVAFGIAAGAAAATLAGRVVEAAVFFGVSPQDPIAFAGAAAILLIAATLAVLAPTRRAATVDAATVLRG